MNSAAVRSLVLFVHNYLIGVLAWIHWAMMEILTHFFSDSGRDEAEGRINWESQVALFRSPWWFVQESSLF